MSGTSTPLHSLDGDVERRLGSTLNGKWRLDTLIGSGGMAAVYAATHRSGWRCAIKILHPHLSGSTTQRERFLREGKIANRVEHPARVPVLDDDVSDRGEPFLVMELLRGETLSARMRRRGLPLRALEVLPIFDTVLDLLAACHEAGVVHRDIKPANVFLAESGVKVIDFGVARMREGLSRGHTTREGIALGTAAYMAPEQAIGSTIDGRADVFSVGACIFHALGGARLHESLGNDDALVKAATEPARSLATVAPHLPAEIVAFVDKAVAFRPEHRYRDARSMQLELQLLRAALEAGLLVEGSGPRPVSTPQDAPTLGAHDPTQEVPSGRYIGGDVAPETPFVPASSHHRLRRPRSSELPPALRRTR